MHRFIKKEKFLPGQTLILDKVEAHHMSRVMRKSDGDNVEIINTMGQLAHCQIQKNTTLKILQVEHTARDKNKAILTVGLSHPSKLEMITEKACELGVDELIIFKGDKSSTKNLSASKLTRLETIRDSALKQSKRLWDMTIRLTPSLETIDFSGKKVYFADLTSQQGLKSTDNDAMIIVGPESGLSDREIAFCKEQNFQAITLGKHVLRAETAAVISAFLLKG